MDDREMALRLGEYIIDLQCNITALQAVFEEYRISTPGGPMEIPWQGKFRKIRRDSQPVVDAQIQSLHRAISDKTPDSELIAELHNQFLKGSSPSSAPPVE